MAVDRVIEHRGPDDRAARGQRPERSTVEFRGDQLTHFDPEEFDFEFNEEKLAAHDITVNEAGEVLWNGFRPLRDKDYSDRYLLLGRTDGGRPLELVAVVRGKKRLRIITGWPL